MSHRTCPHCSSELLPAHGNQVYCSNVCRDAKYYTERPRAACVECSGPTGYMLNRAPSAPRCQPCRRAASDYRVKDKRAKGFMDRWTCGDCSVACERPATKGQRPKWCERCRLMRQNNYIRLSASARLAIYERDGWTCWICTEPVDAELIGSRSDWRPSLDHLLPKSKGGGDETSNLSLAHLWCNVTLNDRRAYTPEDFRN